MNLAIDALIALGLIMLAAQTVGARGALPSIMAFVVFGLLMAVAWARLHAPDLALAEAALGAGIMGALLLVAWRRIQADDQPLRTRPARPPWLTGVAAATGGGVVAAIGWSAMGLPAAPGAAGEAAWEQLPAQPVENPVTAVLLLFRGYDTLLEMAVLLAAWLGASCVTHRDRHTVFPTPAHSEVPLVGALLSLVVPTAMLVAIYLLKTGGNAPGGAFQGGAVLAAAGVLLVLSGRVINLHHTPPLQRWTLVIGLLMFMVAGSLGLLRGEAMLTLPGLGAIYAVETAMLLSIGLTLSLLFATAPGLGRRPGP